jgi:hypothetical protein
MIETMFAPSWQDSLRLLHSSNPYASVNPINLDWISTVLVTVNQHSGAHLAYQLLCGRSMLAPLA